MPLNMDRDPRQNIPRDQVFEKFTIDRPGKIIFVGHHLSTKTHLRCLIRTISLYGADLEVSPHVPVPSNFFLEILGIHDEIGRQFQRVDVMVARKRVDPRDRRVFVLGCDECCKAIESPQLPRLGRQVEAFLAAAEVEPHRVQPDEEASQRFPPQGMGAFGKAAGDEYGAGNPMPFEDGKSVLDVVAVAVVQREDGEGLGTGGRQTGRDVFDRNEVVAVVP